MFHTHTLQKVNICIQTFLSLFLLKFFLSSILLLDPPNTFIPSTTLFFISFSVPPLPSTNIPRYLNSFTSSSFLPPTNKTTPTLPPPLTPTPPPPHSSLHISSSPPPILITLLFAGLTFNLMFVHFPSNSLTSILNFSPDSATNTASSAKSKTFTSHSPSIFLNLIPFPSLSISLTTPSIIRLNNMATLHTPFSIPLLC